MNWVSSNLVFFTIAVAVLVFHTPTLSADFPFSARLLQQVNETEAESPPSPPPTQPETTNVTESTSLPSPPAPKPESTNETEAASPPSPPALQAQLTNETEAGSLHSPPEPAEVKKETPTTPSSPGGEVSPADTKSNTERRTEEEVQSTAKEEEKIIKQKTDDDPSPKTEKTPGGEEHPHPDDPKDTEKDENAPEKEKHDDDRPPESEKSSGGEEPPAGSNESEKEEKTPATEKSKELTMAQQRDEQSRDIEVWEDEAAFWAIGVVCLVVAGAYVYRKRRQGYARRLQQLGNRGKFETV